MLVSIAKLKEYLGMPTTDDPVADPVLTRSSLLAQSLVSGYVGAPIESTDEVVTHSVADIFGVKVVRLPVFPARLVSLTVNGVLVPQTEYAFNPRLATLTFLTTGNRSGMASIKYVPGFDPDEPLPQDLEDVIANLAISIYEKGGTLSQGSTVGLKSMTMFDAMSMSFDTGASTADSSPEGMVKQWAFVLDKYRVGTYIMGSAT